MYTTMVTIWACYVPYLFSETGAITYYTLCVVVILTATAVPLITNDGRCPCCFWGCHRQMPLLHPCAAATTTAATT